MMDQETVRIGLLIRQKKVNISLIKGIDLDGIKVEKGSYEISATEPANTPEWGGRVQVYTGKRSAEVCVERLAEKGIKSSILDMGRDFTWGNYGKLVSKTYAVVIGRETTAEVAIENASNTLQKLRPGDIKGLRVFEDEIPWVEAVRLNPPSGGEIQLIHLETGKKLKLPSPVVFPAEDVNPFFTLNDIRIGIDFHWDHKENIAFKGSLELHADGESVTVVNELEIDTYLTSVLGSEMRPDWGIASLAAQAVAAKSTILATRGRHHFGEAFDLCHDDHCQCYRGAGREGETAKLALDRVKDVLLVHGNRVADARYAKTCGGISDVYSVAWDEEEIEYMVPVLCNSSLKSGDSDLKLKLSGDGEENLNYLLDNNVKWVACNPEVNDYPESAKEMEELYKWRFHFSQKELRELIEKRLKMSLGDILELTPLERGVSGRIKYLRIVGSEKTVSMGKELRIRRLLSDSHLPSSAFRVLKGTDGSFEIVGIGWGHGVGMCQLGAAVLADKGWSEEEILLHYYPGTKLIVG